MAFWVAPLGASERRWPLVAYARRRPSGDQAGSNPSDTFRSAPLARATIQTSSGALGSVTSPGPSARGRLTATRAPRGDQLAPPSGRALLVSRRGGPPSPGMT